MTVAELDARMMIAAETLYRIRAAGGLVLRMPDGHGGWRLEIRGRPRILRSDIQRLLNLEEFAMVLLRELVSGRTRYPI